MNHSSQLQVDLVKVAGHLNGLLRGECSARDTYQIAIDKLGSDAPGQLFDCLNSHRLRCELLSERILELRGEPVESGGVWGAFAHLFASGAAMFGRKAIYTALEEGEAHGLAQYRGLLDQLDTASQRLVEQDLLPEQHRTHNVMNALLLNCA